MKPRGMLLINNAGEVTRFPLNYLLFLQTLLCGRTCCCPLPRFFVVSSAIRSVFSTTFRARSISSLSWLLWLVSCCPKAAAGCHWKLVLCQEIGKERRESEPSSCSNATSDSLPLKAWISLPLLPEARATRKTVFSDKNFRLMFRRGSNCGPLRAARTL